MYTNLQPCYNGHKVRFKHAFFRQLSVSKAHRSEVDSADIIPSAKPVHMDIETLKAYEAQWNPFDADYARKLEKLKSDSKFEPFRDVIDFMLVHRCRLEQENVSLKSTVR